MDEISLHILDIAENSVKAGAKNVVIEINESDKLVSVVITDDGRGMDGATLRKAMSADPFLPERAGSGRGIPLLKNAAEQTGGEISVISHEGSGTSVSAVFVKESDDFIPLGDAAATVASLFAGAPDTDIRYKHSFPAGGETRTVGYDTKDLRKAVRDGSVPLVSAYLTVRDSIREEYEKIRKILTCEDGGSLLA